MKWHLFILIVVSILSLSGCKKIFECERWEVSDDCTETGNCYWVGCGTNNSGVHQEEICGNELKDAKPNNTITIKGSCTTIRRTFLRKL